MSGISSHQNISDLFSILPHMTTYWIIAFMLAMIGNTRMKRLQKQYTKSEHEKLLSEQKQQWKLEELIGWQWRNVGEAKTAEGGNRNNWERKQQLLQLSELSEILQPGQSRAALVDHPRINFFISAILWNLVMVENYPLVLKYYMEPRHTKSAASLLYAFGSSSVTTRDSKLISCLLFLLAQWVIIMFEFNCHSTCCVFECLEPSMCA